MSKTFHAPVTAIYKDETPRRVQRWDPLGWAMVADPRTGTLVPALSVAGFSHLSEDQGEIDLAVIQHGNRAPWDVKA